MRGSKSIIINNQILLLFLSLVLFKIGTSQELVPNGGFEEFEVCPQEFNKNDGGPLGASNWYGTDGFPDYFNKCSENMYLNGINPRSGKGCMGIVTYWNEPQVKREFIYTTLKSSLIKNQKYCVRFYIALSSTSEMYSYNIGLLFTNAILSSSPLHSDFIYSPQIVSKIPLLDTAWMEVTGVYTATGVEKVIYIGNFLRPNGNAGSKRPDWILQREIPEGVLYVPHSHYLIDDISIIPIENEFDCSSFGVPIQLENVCFENGKSKLLQSSLPTLEKLAEYLLKNEHIGIEIHGHTDSLGGILTNQKLSEKRARAVRDYLISKGVSKRRVSTKGYGGTQPIYSNATESGRKKNRRVEFVLIKT